MKYAYRIQKEYNNNIEFRSSDNLIFLTEISQEEHDKFVAEKQAGKIIYLDDNGKLCSRDKNTIWDEKSKSYVVDKAAIEAEAKQVLISEANQAYHSNMLDRHQYNKLDSNQQKELDGYLDSLLEIVNGKSKAKELPVKPSFLG